MNQSACPRGTDHAELVTVIKTEALLGRGTTEDPCRTQIRYWDQNGTLLATVDTWETNLPPAEEAGG